MEIADKSRCENLSMPSHALRVSCDEAACQCDVEIPVEHLVDVSINGVLAMTLTCTPRDIIELVLGRLFTEGLIDRADDVLSIDLCEHSEHVRVDLREARSSFVRQTVEQVDTCCANSRNLVRRRCMSKMAGHLEALPIDSGQIFHIARVFADDTPLHATTLGVHSCSLFEGYEQLYSFEDLGRHNAFDKAVGAALMDDADMAKLTVFTSGRVPVDMITKAIRSRIPLLVTKATPTTQSVAIAQEYGLALVGRARPDSYCIFSGE